MDEVIKNYHNIRNRHDSFSITSNTNKYDILAFLADCEANLEFMENICPYYQTATPTDGRAVSGFDHGIMIQKIKKQIKLLEIELEKRKELKAQKELERKELRMFDLELEKQRQAQEHELAKMDKLLQIEEMKLIREREQREAEREQVDSLKDSIRQS